tara:strand:- start:156 stop:536 length:381 start_codon:yes stop_codon:yes gene_type:complete
VIFLSKYFSTAKENKNNENADISMEGINVKREKKAIYLRLALDPSTTISLLIEFFTSKKIKRKNITRRTILDINKYCKFWSLSLIKLLSKKVRNVKKPNNNVTRKIITIKKFFLMKFSIIFKSRNT